MEGAVNKITPCIGDDGVNTHTHYENTHYFFAGSYCLRSLVKTPDFSKSYNGTCYSF